MDALPVIRDYIVETLLHRKMLPLTPETRLIEEGYLTSLQTVELVLFLEERFEVTIDPDEVSEQNFATLRSISDLVASKLQESVA